MSEATATAGTARVSDTLAGPKVRNRISRRAVGPMLMVFGIVAVAIGSGAFWMTGGRYVTIDDSYVRAAKETLSTDVSGIVMEVPVREGQRVRKGEVLLRLDPRQFQIAVQGATAVMNGMVLTLNAEKLDYNRMVRDADGKQQQVAADQANFDRMASLVKMGGVTRADYDNARYQLAANQQALAALRVQASRQLAMLGGDAEVDVHTMPDYLQAKAKVEEAQRELDHTVVYAPFSGIVTQVDTVQPGMYLAAATAAFGIISTEDVWVEANPKETELTWVKPGDKVAVTVDTYPGRTWEGTVQSIAPNSGSEFSILPAQNTSGNWVKVVQRIPVRISVPHKDGDPDLRAGMSVEAEIDTGHHRTLAELF
ncbi:MAG TPA: HlyD family secretion protein [Acetobacteraceae bacterium]|jgi:membrane fusion protein (multidrug efflux system)|nr:HlyD family secretion protein [Acetobacteraceae bacterium]